VCDVPAHLATYSRVTTTPERGYVGHAPDVTRVALPGVACAEEGPGNAAGAALPEENGPCCVVLGGATRRSRPPGGRSLDGDGGAGALERGLGLLGGVLGDLLQDRLRRVVDQVLGLLEAGASAAAPPPAGPAAATATGAAAVTSKVSSNCFTKSDSSRRVISLNASSRASVDSLAMCVSF
jgi:hypothetical protein